MEEKEPNNDTIKVSLFEFRHNLGLLLDTRYKPLGLQVSHIEKEYNFWFANCQSVNLNRLETHEKSWIELFKNEILLKDRFLVSTKSGPQYVRSNPDKLAEESKELFNFVNYTELQRWKQKQRSEENTIDAESQTDSMYPNLTVAQESTNHSINGEFMPEMPPPVTTPPEDDDPKTTTYSAEENEQYFGVNDDYFYLSANPNYQNSADSASTEFVLDEDIGIQKMGDGFENQKTEEAYEKEFIPVTAVTPDFEIELEENYADDEQLKNPPLDPVEPWPSSSSPTNFKRGGGSPIHYPDEYENVTSVESQRSSEGQTLEEKDIHPDDNMEEFPASVSTNTSAPNTKRRLSSTSNYSSEEYGHRKVVKSSRIHQRHSFEGHIPFDDYTRPESSNKQNLETSSKYFEHDVFGEGTQNDQSTLPRCERSNVFENQMHDSPKLIQEASNLVTGINMDENLLVRLTELVKGIRSTRRLEGSTSKSTLKDTWIVFPLQDNGLGIYLSDRDGTPFNWNRNKWDPNIRTRLHPSHRDRPFSFTLPPNSLIYGEIVEIEYVSGRREPFEQFHVIDIAALEGGIFKEGFYARRSICKAYLENTQRGQQAPKIYVTMKPVSTLMSLESLSMFRSSYAENGAFHLTRTRTSMEIGGIGLLQLCPTHGGMSGRNEFVFSMNQRYFLTAPRPSSSTPSLERHVWKELSKVFRLIID